MEQYLSSDQQIFHLGSGIYLDEYAITICVVKDECLFIGLSDKECQSNFYGVVIDENDICEKRIIRDTLHLGTIILQYISHDRDTELLNKMKLNINKSSHQTYSIEIKLCVTTCINKSSEFIYITDSHTYILKPFNVLNSLDNGNNLSLLNFSFKQNFMFKEQYNRHIDKLNKQILNINDTTNNMETATTQIIMELSRQNTEFCQRISELTNLNTELTNLNTELSRLNTELTNRNAELEKNCNQLRNDSTIVSSKNYAYSNALSEIYDILNNIM